MAVRLPGGAPGRPPRPRGRGGRAGPAADGDAADCRAGRLLACESEYVEPYWDNRVVCRTVGDHSDGKHLWRADYEPGVDPVSAALLPDGRAATIDRRRDPRRADEFALAVRAADTGAVVASTPLPGRVAGSLTASPDGETLVVNAGTSLVFCRTADPSPRKVVFGRKHCTGLAFHPSGAYLLAAGNDGTVRRLDARTGKTLASYAWRHGKARCVAVSPDRQG